MLYEWFRHIEFAYPALLALLLLVPYLWWWHRKRERKKLAALTVSTTWVFNVKSWRNHFAGLPFILRLLSVASVILALARPQVRHSDQRQEGEGIDIMLCMDVSGSMGSRDIAPSRLEAAKAVAVEFVNDRPVDRIGLVIFSGESFTQCPLTSDRATLISQIQNLESRRYLTDGTVIGEGLATAVDRLSASKAKSRIIILLTDGKEDPPETRLIDPLTALDIARTRGVKVYTIGMSANPVSPAPVAAEGKRSAAVDFLDEELLKKIAGQTGGQYFRVADKTALQKVYGQIDLLEKSKVEIISSRRDEERFQPFLAAALLFLLLEVVLRFTLFRKFP